MQTKDVQGSNAAADWARLIEPTLIPLYRSVLEKLDFNEEKVMLDAGCGSGLFLSMVVSTGASVHGIDAIPGLLALSRKRVPGVTLLIEDLEDVPFSDGSFDVVTGFNSFQYASSFPNALCEARRVTKRGGNLVIGIWGKEKDCDAAVILSKVGTLLQSPVSGVPSAFALSEEGKIETILQSVGLKLIEKQTVSCPWQFTSVKDLNDGFMCTAPCTKAAQVVGSEIVIQAISESAEPFAVADGIYYMRNEFSFFITEKK